MMYGRGFYDQGRFFFDRGFYGMIIWFILITVGVIILTISIVKMLSQKNNHKDNKGSNENLRKILDERYVKGEITEEEYKAKKKFIEDN